MIANPAISRVLPCTHHLSPKGSKKNNIIFAGCEGKEASAKVKSKVGESRSLSPKRLAPNGGSSWHARRTKKGSNKVKNGKPKSTSISPKADRSGRSNYRHFHQQCPLMTVLIKRVDLLDGAVAEENKTNALTLDHPHLIYFETDEANTFVFPQTFPFTHYCANKTKPSSHKILQTSLTGPVAKFDFQCPHEKANAQRTTDNQVSIMRIPLDKHAMKYWKNHFSKNQKLNHYVSNNNNEKDDVVNPHPSSVVHDKYWAQRHRLFSRFDQGIMLDSEGWYSVTPEIIADHVAEKLGEIVPSIFQSICGDSVSQGAGIVVLDAFCGMGGNSIAFGKIPHHLVSLVVCVDVDRSKLRMAANNASLYNIPADKLLFIESNSLFVMDQCYRNGKLVFNTLPGEVSEENSCSELRSSFSRHHPPCREQCCGYTIGGFDLLPNNIDAIFMDPPWGGVDYEAAGKNGYDLKKNMKINYYADIRHSKHPPASDCGNESVALYKTVKEEHNKPLVVDGFSILKMAAAATKSKFVIYDLPRNTKKVSLGQAALEAGYKGNILLEEHYLNGRLKTITAYLGIDFV